MKKPKVYLAQPMGGRLWGDVRVEAQYSTAIAKAYGLDPWSPPMKETTYTSYNDVVQTSQKDLRRFWQVDKRAIDMCDALISIRGDMVSEGVGFEIGMAKYKYGIPVVVVAPTTVGRITHLEADHVSPTLADACDWLVKKLDRSHRKKR